MLLFLRGSNAGHDATRRVNPFSGNKNSALLAVLPRLGQVSVVLLTQTASGPPATESPRDRSRSDAWWSPRACESCRQPPSLATNVQHDLARLLEVCRQDIFSLYRINSLWLLRGCFPRSCMQNFVLFIHKEKYKYLFLSSCFTFLFSCFQKEVLVMPFVVNFV